MIDLFTGTPGSGKSLHMATYIYARLRRGLPVLANFEINTDNIKRCKGEFIYIPNNLLDASWLIDFSRKYFSDKPVKEDSILLCIDEAQIIFNAREWNVSGRADWVSFFTQHRKYGYKIIITCQFDMMLDKQVRSLVEYQYIHRKVSNFGTFGKIMSIVSFGNLFISVKMWYPIKQKVGQEFFKAHKKYYSIYDTWGGFERSITKKSLPLSH